MKIGIVGKSRYIDADVLIKDIENCSYETWSKDINRAWWAQAVKVKDNIKQCIERQPTADVVEVVRCRDCKHIETTEYGGYCCLKKTGVAYNDYCSYGERNENGK
jgi:hypothetical protein